MNIKNLKEMIKDLPDDLPVVHCHSGGCGAWTDEPQLKVGTVYKFINTPNYGDRQPYMVEYCELYHGREVKEQYEALIFNTEE